MYLTQRKEAEHAVRWWVIVKLIQISDEGRDGICSTQGEK